MARRKVEKTIREETRDDKARREEAARRAEIARKSRGTDAEGNA